MKSLRRVTLCARMGRSRSQPVNCRNEAREVKAKESCNDSEIGTMFISAVMGRRPVPFGSERGKG